MAKELDHHSLATALVIGAGATGTSLARRLCDASFDLDPWLVLWADIKAEDKAELEAYKKLIFADRADDPAAVLKAKLESLDIKFEAQAKAFDLAIISPGISPSSREWQLAEKLSDELIGEVELAYCLSSQPWLAITGTNGKTTTTALSTELLRSLGVDAREVGNIGRPCIEVVADLSRTRSTELGTNKESFSPLEPALVAELSSYQLYSTRKLAPLVSVLLNITPDHLSWHGSFEAYCAAKEKIFANLSSQNFAVISLDDPYSKAIAERVEAEGIQLVAFSQKGDPKTESAGFIAEDTLMIRILGHQKKLCTIAELELKGAHNYQNALAASLAALCFAYQLEAEGIQNLEAWLELKIALLKNKLCSFAPLHHRIEPVGELKGIHFVNDSKATNVDAAIQGLKAFAPGSVIALLGGSDKGTELESLAEVVHTQACRALCYGEAGERIACALEDYAAQKGISQLHIERVAHLSEAFAEAVRLAQAGQTILLSPACASYDEFDNFEQRGEAFCRLVKDFCSQAQVSERS